MAIFHDYIGKKVWMHLASARRPIKVEVIEIDCIERRATKFRAVYRRDSLGKIGFLKEKDQWVIGDHQICRN